MKIIKEKDAIIKTAKDKNLFTMCDGCIFGSSHPNDNENISDYCSIGRLEKFQKNGAEILNVEFESDPGNNSKLINGRVCNMLRGVQWKESRKKEGLKDEELKARAIEESYINCSAIFYVGKGEGGSDATYPDLISYNWKKEAFDSVCESIKKLDSEKVRPSHVFIINNSGVDAFEFLTEIRRRFDRMNIGLKWTMEHIADKEIRQIESEEQQALACVDIACKNVKSVYYCVFLLGGKIPSGYLDKIDNEINENLSRFLILKPEEGVNGLFVQHRAHKQFIGNKGGKNIIEKIEYLSSEQQCQEIIQPLKKAMESQ
jgi:hypothetical protein